MQTPAKYNFWDIFSYDSDNKLVVPKYNVRINGFTYFKNQPIAQLQNFGGLNLLNYLGKDIAGTWNPESRVLDIVGFYN